MEGRYKSKKDMRVQRDYLTRYGGGCWKKREGIVKSILLPLVKTPEYRLTELPLMVKGVLHSQECMVDEIVELDFFRSVPEDVYKRQLFGEPPRVRVRLRDMRLHFSRRR